MCGIILSEVLKMDIQLKKGLLDVCVLAVLKHGDSYGYKIIKDISPYLEISESTLYPILKRLEQNNHLQVYSEEYNGRLRKYYRITKNGQQKVKDFIEEGNEIVKIIEYIKGVNYNE